MPDRSLPAIQRAAHDILARPEFRPPSVSPIDQVRHWIGQQIQNALSAALSGSFSVLGAVILVAIIGLLAWLVIRLWRGTRSDPAVRFAVVADRRRPPADWLAEAAECERRGDFRGSLRARYRALVSELARRGLVDDIPGRTSGEHRREVREALPATMEDFGGATDLFELAVYGDGPAGPGESARIAELSAKVLAGAP
jgi:hypothetical protein